MPLTVIILKKPENRLAGHIACYLFEIEKNIFVGHANVKLLERLWKKIEKSMKTQYALMIYSAKNKPNRFICRKRGSNSIEPFNHEGLTVFLKKNKEN